MKLRTLLPLLLTAMNWGVLHAQDGADALAASFTTPPAASRPMTWWHWVDGHVTRDGITRDLEAMATAGIGGVVVTSVRVDTAPGPVIFNSPQFHGLLDFAMAECARLGLEFGVVNCDGWSQSGGPWVAPQDAMQVLDGYETVVSGGQVVDLQLPEPFRGLADPQQVAAVAFPLPATQPRPMVHEVRVDGVATEAAKHLVDGDLNLAITLPKQAGPTVIDLALETAAALGGIIITPTAITVKAIQEEPWIAPYEGTVSVSRDGTAFTEVCPARIEPGMRCVVPFPTMHEARVVRLSLASASFSKDFRLAEIELLPGARLRDFDGLSDRVLTRKPGSGGIVVDPHPVPDGSAVAQASVVDLTGLVHDGHLSWSAPAGTWVVQRFVGIARPRANVEATAQGRGLEVDKLSTSALDAHWDAFLGPIIRRAGPMLGTTLKYIECDSWEVGAQNWTPRMEAEFQRRCGYPMRPYLPTFLGTVIGSVEESQRFLWDYRRTIADMVADNYWGHLQQRAEAAGLTILSEPYHGPFDAIQSGGRTGLPMGEFWAQGKLMGTCQLAASAGHVSGRRIIGAEAFTAGPELSAWREHPGSLKAVGDRAFCAGINQFFFHRFTHQAYPGAIPGMTMGKWGSHIDRTNTWWEPAAGPWFTYLTRCQHLLRQGRFHADILRYTGESQPDRDLNYPELRPEDHRGFVADIISREGLMRLDVIDGQLVLPSGMRYRLLVLPTYETRMSPEVIATLKALVERGARVLGPKPTASPSLIGYPHCDAVVQRTATALWSSADGTKGTVLRGCTIPQALACPVDFRSTPEAPLSFTHRILDDGDLYFVAHGGTTRIRATCRFRITGRRPELWQPETGAIHSVPLWSEDAGVTSLDLAFDPGQSVFVVFRSPATAPAAAIPPVEPEAPSAPLAVAGPWTLAFPGVAGESPAALGSWTDSTTFDIRHFSGTATYRTVFEVPTGMRASGRRIRLDLGDVQVVARVTVNGTTFPVCWKAPYQVDVTDALTASTNALAVEVTNLWVNRLIGDEQYPDDTNCWSKQGTGGLTAIPDWVIAGSPRPEPRRKAFVSFKHWGKGDPLLPSGLIGPVHLQAITAGSAGTAQ